MGVVERAANGVEMKRATRTAPIPTLSNLGMLSAFTRVSKRPSSSRRKVVHVLQIDLLKAGIPQGELSVAVMLLVPVKEHVWTIPNPILVEKGGGLRGRRMDDGS